MAGLHLPMPGVMLILTCLGLCLGGYQNAKNYWFHPKNSTTFKLVMLGNVNLTFLDNTKLNGYDGQDFIEIGNYRVETRMGMVTECNSANFNNVDGILGFGWSPNNRSAALLKTLTQDARPGWKIKQPADFTPMPRKFSFTATRFTGELQLGGYDPEAIDGEMHLFPMTHWTYGVNVSSIKYGDGVDAVELLNFNKAHPRAMDHYMGEFDSGTTCLLIPNTTANGTLLESPFEKLLGMQLDGIKKPLVYTLKDINGVEREYTLDYEECVEPSQSAMILGDAWFRKWVVLHDLVDLNNKRMGLGLRKTDYTLAGDQFIKRESDKSRVMSLDQLGSQPSGSVQRVAAKRQMKTVEGQELAMLSVTPVQKVGLINPSQVVYNIPIQVGTPPQPMEVIFDTGSYMLAIFSDPAPPGIKPLLAQVETPHKSEWEHFQERFSSPFRTKQEAIRATIKRLKAAGLTKGRVASYAVVAMQVGEQTMAALPSSLDPRNMPALVTLNVALAVVVVALAVRMRRKAQAVLRESNLMSVSYGAV